MRNPPVGQPKKKVIYSWATFLGAPILMLSGMTGLVGVAFGLSAMLHSLAVTAEGLTAALGGTGVYGVAIFVFSAVEGGEELRASLHRSWLKRSTWIATAALGLLYVSGLFSQGRAGWLPLTIAGLVASYVVGVAASVLFTRFPVIFAQVKGRRKPRLDDWSDEELAEAEMGMALFGKRWPDPEATVMTEERARAYATLGEEAALTASNWGQILVLVSGGAIGVVLTLWIAPAPNHAPVWFLWITGALCLLGTGITGVVTPNLEKRARAYSEYAKSKAAASKAIAGNKAQTRPSLVALGATLFSRVWELTRP